VNRFILVASCGLAATSLFGYQTELKRSVGRAALTPEVAKEALANGFKGVEVNKVAITEAEAKAQRAVAQANGLEIPTVMGRWYALNDASQYEAELAKLRADIRTVSLLGGKNLLVVPAVPYRKVAMPPLKRGVWKATFDPQTLEMSACSMDGKTYPEYVAFQNEATRAVRKAIQAVLPDAEKAGVVIAIENVANTLWVDPAFASAFVRSFNSKWVQAFVDPANHIFTSDSVEWVEAMKGVSAGVHVKDFKLSDDYEFGMDLRNFGEGSVDLKALRDALDRTGYSGFVSLEGEKKLKLPEVATRLDRFIAGEPVAPGAVDNALPGRWALDMPCGWVGIRELLDGTLEVKLLWDGGSPLPFKYVEVKDGVISAYVDWTPADQVTVMDLTWHYYRYAEMRVENGELKGWFMGTDGAGNFHTKKTEFTGRRLPPLPPAPDMKALKFGQPIDLLKDGLAGWDKIGKTEGRRFGWEVTPEGTLKNTIRYDHRGVAMEHGINIVTKRKDFEDFKISYDVKVPPKGNSGVYLRGIYEVQTCDSYGKPVDSHNMAALYSRITPRVAAEKPANEWQHVEATLCDRHVTIILNGVNIIDNQPILGITGGSITTDETKPGPIYLQGDHTSAEYRNMILTPIVK